MAEKIYNVLFLCTGNSARSIMAEALINQMGRGQFRGFSAGSHPTGAVNPFAIALISSTKFPCEQLRSKSWSEFASPGAPHMDFVFTVCDNAAGEMCPVWPGHPLSAHWSFADPALVVGSDEAKRAAFHKVFRELMTRLNIFVSLPLAMLEKNAIQREIDAIGAHQLDA